MTRTHLPMQFFRIVLQALRRAKKAVIMIATITIEITSL
jgi:hypothetical protein